MIDTSLNESTGKYSLTQIAEVINGFKEQGLSRNESYQLLSIGITMSTNGKIDLRSATDLLAEDYTRLKILEQKGQSANQITKSLWEKTEIEDISSNSLGDIAADAGEYIAAVVPQAAAVVAGAKIVVDGYKYISNAIEEDYKNRLAEYENSVYGMGKLDEYNIGREVDLDPIEIYQGIAGIGKFDMLKSAEYINGISTLGFIYGSDMTDYEKTLESLAENEQSSLYLIIASKMAARINALAAKSPQEKAAMMQEIWAQYGELFNRANLAGEDLNKSIETVYYDPMNTVIHDPKINDSKRFNMHQSAETILDVMANAQYAYSENGAVSDVDIAKEQAKNAMHLSKEYITKFIKDIEPQLNEKIKSTRSPFVQNIEMIKAGSSSDMQKQSDINNEIDKMTTAIAENKSISDIYALLSNFAVSQLQDNFPNMYSATNNVWSFMNDNPVVYDPIADELSVEIEKWGIINYQLQYEMTKNGQSVNPLAYDSVYNTILDSYFKIIDKKKLNDMANYYRSKGKEIPASIQDLTTAYEKFVILTAGDNSVSISDYALFDNRFEQMRTEPGNTPVQSESEMKKTIIDKEIKEHWPEIYDASIYGLPLQIPGIGFVKPGKFPLQIHTETPSPSNNTALYDYINTVNMYMLQRCHANGGRAIEASIFGEAGPEWAIPERHDARTAELLNSAREASGFSWNELIASTGGLNGGGNVVNNNITYAPVVHANDARGVEDVLSKDKQMLDDWWKQKQWETARTQWA